MINILTHEAHILSRGKSVEGNYNLYCGKAVYNAFIEEMEELSGQFIMTLPHGKEISLRDIKSFVTPNKIKINIHLDDEMIGYKFIKIS